MNHHEIEKIRNDLLSGAAHLSSNALKALVSVIEDDTSTSPGEFLSNISDTAELLIYTKPFFASIRNRVLPVLDTVKSLTREVSTLEELRTRSIDYLTRANRRYGEYLRRLSHHAMEVFSPHIRVLTYSASWTVHQIFKRAAHEEIPFSVVLSEGRPMKEGTHFAKLLAKQSIPTKLVIDIHLPHFIPSAQCIVIGADWISEVQFTNKIGSAILVDMAVKQHIPVFIAATTDKILAQKYYPITIDEQSPNEVLKTNDPFLTVQNRYFEAVPLDEDIKFITEKGIIEHADIVRMAEATRSDE